MLQLIRGQKYRRLKKSASLKYSGLKISERKWSSCIR
jgi:hypothetical protein